MKKEKVVESYEANLEVINVLIKELDFVKDNLEKVRRNFKMFKHLIENL